MERQRQKGFTLVEMAIVLVIIGIILASVMKGRDLIHSAGQTQVEQAFMQKWVTMINDYNKATGAVFNDGTRNGFVTPATLEDGWDDGYNLAVSPQPDPLGVPGPAHPQSLLNALAGVGIGYCQLVKSTLNDLTNATVGSASCPDDLNVFVTMVDSEFSGKVRIGVALGNYIFINLNGDATPQRKNVLVFKNVPLDIAMRFDRVVDGTESGTYGTVVNASVFTSGETPSTAVLSNAPANGNKIDLSSRDWPALTPADRGNVFAVAYILDH
jgi:prepilin-type N-terminal cleavage/methylation domain-containing protein